ncbi:hypothetical protein [Mesorhizobium sp. NZP2298]|uniref:hypothetical protein n=1 Tax=Mesorhizobium sp. NZP2298 TaxID=2483403 RepID=UPI001551A062|nr:hypothetical protein [Mesorhizobium sp. NZP2298]
MTFFSSRVMPRLVPPAVDAIAIDMSSRETLALDATPMPAFSSERRLKKAEPSGKKWQKAPADVRATMGL